MPERYAPPPRRRRRRRASRWLPILIVSLCLAIIAAVTVILVTSDALPFLPRDTVNSGSESVPPETEPPVTEPITDPPETVPPVIHTLDGTLSLLHYGTGATDTAYTADRLIYAISALDVFDVPADFTPVKAGDTLFVQQLASLGETAAEAETALADLNGRYTEIQAQATAAREALEQLFMRRAEVALTLEGLHIKAPSNGTLLTVSAMPGMTAQKDQPLATLLTSPSLRITQYFSYAHAATVFVGMKAYINVSDPELLLDATVTDISFIDHTDEEGVPCFAVTMDVELTETLTDSPESLDVTAYFQNDRGIKVYPMVKGRLHFRDLLTVTAPADGTVGEIFCYAGTAVAADAPLFVLQNPALVAELADLEESLPEAIEQLNALERQQATLMGEVSDAAANLERIKEAIESERKFGIAKVDGVLRYLPTMAHMTDGVLAGTAIAPREPLMLIARPDMTALLFTLPETDDGLPIMEETVASETASADAAASASASGSDTPDTDALAVPQAPEAAPLPATDTVVTLTVTQNGIPLSTSATVRFVTERILILTVPDEVAALFIGGDVTAVISYEEALS